MLLTLVIIVFGVVGLILSGGFVEDIFAQLRAATIHSRLGHIQVYTEGYYEYGRRDPYRYMIPNPAEISEQLAEWPQVEEVMERLTFFGLINNGRTDIPVVAEGIQPEKEARVGSFFFISKGRMLTENDGNAVLLGEGVANSLQLAPGDYANFLVSTADGSLNALEMEVVGIFRTFSKDYDDRAVRVPLTLAKDVLDTEKAHAIVILLRQDAATDAMAENLRRMLGPHGYEIWTWLQLDDFYPKTVALYKGLFGFLQLIILLIVMLSVLSSVSMTMHERIGEFGTMRAIGLRSNQLYWLVFLENSMLGIGGAAIGVLVGMGLAALISWIGIPMPPPPNSNSGYTALVRIVPSVLAMAFIVGVSATLFSALISARKPTRQPIVDALRQNV